MAAVLAPPDGRTLGAVLGRLIAFGERYDLIGGPHRLGSDRERDTWADAALDDLRAAVGSLPEAAVMAGLESVLSGWRSPRLPMPGDLRAAVEALPGWGDLRLAQQRIRTARWVLSKQRRGRA